MAFKLSIWYFNLFIVFCFEQRLTTKKSN